MELAVVVAVVLVLAALLSVVGYFVLLPAIREEGEDRRRALEEARRAGLDAGLKTAQEAEAQAERDVDAKLAADKQRDPVEVANELIREKP